MAIAAVKAATPMKGPNSGTSREVGNSPSGVGGASRLSKEGFAGRPGLFDRDQAAGGGLPHSCPMDTAIAEQTKSAVSFPEDALVVDTGLLRKYGGAGPRYTSYPT